MAKEGGRKAGWKAGRRDTAGAETSGMNWSQGRIVAFAYCLRPLARRVIMLVRIT